MPPTARLNTVAREWNVAFEPDVLRQAVGFVLGESAKTAKAKPQEDHGRVVGEQEIRGMMTLNEISLKTGASKELMLKRIGAPSAAVDARKPVREWLQDHQKTVQGAVAAWRPGKR